MNGLSLGQIPFPQGYEPYTPPERRRRKRRADARRAAGGAPVGPGALRTRTGTARKVGAGAALSINPDGGTDYGPFLGVQPQRIRGALGASVASHTIGFILLLVVLRVAPIEEFVDVSRTNYNIIWIPQEGPGGGGGGSALHRLRATGAQHHRTYNPQQTVKEASAEEMEFSADAIEKEPGS